MNIWRQEKFKNHEAIRNQPWGTYGKEGKVADFQWIPVCSLSNDHIRMILTTQFHIGANMTQLFLDELAYRSYCGIYIEDMNRYPQQLEVKGPQLS